MHARTLEELSASPSINLDDLIDWSFNGEARARCEAQAAPYFKAFEAHKADRHQAISRKCEYLEAGPIVISTFNWGFRRLFENFVASCDHHGIACRAFTLLFPMDEDADAFARDLGFQTYYDGVSYGELPTGACKVFGDGDFRKCLFAKLAMTQDMLEIGADQLRQDVDMVWLRDPRQCLAQRMDHEGLDFLFMYDGPNPSCQPLHYNSGFVYIRNNSHSRYTWNFIFSNYASILSSGSEQVLINAVLNCLRERGLRCDRLPEEKFLNGHVISRAINEKKPLPASSASVVHASWTTNIEVKVAHLKRFGFWYL